MKAEQAIAIVENNRRTLKISQAMKHSSAKRAIVVHRPGGEAQGPGVDRIAWIVTLTSPMGFVCVDVDDSTGQVLNISRSA